MPEKPMTEAQRIEAAKKAKKKSDEVTATAETEINKADLGEAAKKEATKAKPAAEIDPDAPAEGDSPITAAAKKNRRALKAKALRDVVKEQK